MKKLQKLPKVTLKQTLFNIPLLISLSLGNILHFTLEFSVLQTVNLPYLFIIFHMIGVPVGAFFAVKVSNKWNNIVAFSSNFILLIIFLMSLIIILNPIYTPFGLFGAGFFIGGMSGPLMITSASSIPKSLNSVVGGRLFARGFAVSSIFVIIYALLNLTINFTLTLIYFSLILIVSLVFIFIIKIDFQSITQENLNISTYFKNKKNLSKMAVYFFHGFFIINTYYAAILIFDWIKLGTYLNSFVLFLFIIIAIGAIPTGIIADRIGRRITIMIGLAVQALAFLILSFLNEINIILIVIFILFLGIGFNFIYVGFTQLRLELPEKTSLRDESSLSVGFLGIGSAVGVILGEVLNFLIRTNTAYLTIVLLFVFICATIVVFQVRETLPSRSEKFVKPDFIDDDELTLYKERKICLVCKGDATGFEVYVCTDCGVLYCLKCAKALSTLENICWGCDAPIDKSKPIQPLKGAEEEIKKDIIKDKFK